MSVKNLVIHQKLRSRLFDISRRNRLLYYKPNLKFLNLTIASVPLSVETDTIKPESIFTVSNEIEQLITASKDILLTKYLDIEEDSYLIPILHKIKSEDNRNINEYGFSQLKLAIIFLNWFNIKEDKNEKIFSPLVFIPVDIVRKKSIKDQYSLEISGSEAEINPVMIYLLKELYNIQLPETIELDAFKISELINLINEQITKQNSELTLEILSQPDIKSLHKKAILIQDKLTKKNKSVHAADNRFNNQQTETTDETEINSNTWELDLCNIVLGNFNYKKMSLVSDYNEIIDKEKDNPVFDLLFNDLPENKINTDHSALVFNELYNVVASDPTQNNAVLTARQNTSYIIQGPPGTGKSQTITNLIADFVAAGKKVLFVCEKRAAIDVVFHRLKQENLDELCCLIHDSQADKKEFILNLKKNYEINLKNTTKVEDVIKQRNEIIQYLQQELKIIEHFTKIMKTEISSANLKSIEIYHKLIELNEFAEDLHNINIDEVAGYKEWTAFGKTIEELFNKLKSHNHKNYFEEHPLSLLNDLIFETEPTPTELKNKLTEISLLTNEITEYLELTEFEENYSENISDLKQVLHNIEDLKLFSDNKQLELLNDKSNAFQQFLYQRNELLQLDKDIESIQLKNIHWKQKFSETDTLNALQIAQNLETSFFRIFYSAYRRIKSGITNAYDFSKHQIKPQYSQLLQQLKEEYEIIKIQNQKINDAESLYQLGNLETAYQQIIKCRQQLHPEIIKLITENADEKQLNNLLLIKTKFERLIKLVLQTFDHRYTQKLTEIEQTAESILPATTDLNVYLSYLSALLNTSPKLKQILKTGHYSPKQIETILAKKSMSDFYVLHKDIEKIDGHVLEYHLERIKKLHHQFLKINGTYIRAKQREQFMNLVFASEKPVTGKPEKEKEEKRQLQEGRKILENEFNKSMRFKSIRTLASDVSGKFIRELKPVWLMSSLSVSDTLPLDAQYFDVVIFDEASQITLEEGIPTIFRASQAIIVGDEMQMPPSNFFGSRNNNIDDLWQEENEDINQPELDADSLLNQAARKLPSVLLGWHYRSRHESLIGFSNAAFYENKLLTIPDNTDTQQILNEISINEITEATGNFKYLFDRPISYHYLQNSIYENRTNENEANYIAELLYQFYLKKNTESIGIVAFSIEQQNKIEYAIEQKANKDKSFDKWLDNEFKRIENNQFIGLFVKNLENVQGDERDIIIISTCYGYDKEKKMLMNFGPINRKGGEKRLNVIFSRAKKQVCVVTSIKHSDIRNDHNEGASFFKRYLQYAALMSTGNLIQAQDILNSFTLQTSKPPATINHLQQQICEALNKLGYYTAINIGQSHFKCHIGIKRNKDDKNYLSGIILDDENHYANTDLIEQYLLKPEILRNFGWNIITVFAKDWYENKTKMIQTITNKLEGKNEILNSGKTVISDTEDLLNKRINFTENKQKDLVENFNSPLNKSTVRLILEENNLNKFWQITQNKNSLIIEFGKVNTSGQKIIKPYQTEIECAKEMKRLIEQKKKKGFKIA